MNKLKITIMLFIIGLSICSAQAATFTECRNKACAIVTVPDQINPDQDFEVLVEGYIEDASSWDTSSYILFEDADWHYDDSNLVVSQSGIVWDSKGLHWGGSFSKAYTFNRPAGKLTFTFVFGARSFNHEYYDVAVDATVEIASSLQPIAFDLKPQACPNRLNTNKKGVLSAAIVGSLDIDVTNIELSSVQIAGVKPIHFTFQDVAEPYLPFTGKLSAYECTDAGSDGYMDLVMKFKTQDLLNALQENNQKPFKEGDHVTVQITAESLGVGTSNVKTAFIGEDILLIVHRK